MLTNFQHVDINWNVHSIQLRRRDVVLMWQRFGVVPKIFMGWVTRGVLINNSNKTFKQNREENLHLSQESRLQTSYMLDLKTYSMKAKPWTCQIDMGLKHNSSGFTLSPDILFKQARSINYYKYNVVPSSVSVLHFIISYWRNLSQLIG